MSLKPLYQTELGKAFHTDSLKLLPTLPDAFVDLVVTSPPYALHFKKEYGNANQGEYVEWFMPFAREIRRVLKPEASFVLNIGGSWTPGAPVRSLYHFRLLLALCDDLGFHLCQEFFWYNPAKLPSPIEWVNKRKIRVKDAVDTVWWLSKCDHPKADVRRVLVPYSARMRKLLQDASRFYTPKKRPSGHDISGRFATANAGAIPSNLLEIPNTESNSAYLRLCALAEIGAHPARFPQRLPAFFIDFLTEPGDLVVDIFAGSNTTGAAAEEAARRWLAFELDQDYLSASLFRFAQDLTDRQALDLYGGLRNGTEPAVHISRLQSRLVI